MSFEILNESIGRERERELRQVPKSFKPLIIALIYDLKLIRVIVHHTRCDARSRAKKAPLLYLGLISIKGT